VSDASTGGATPAGEVAATDRDWVSAHLFHQGDLDLLLTRLVRPLTADLAEAGLSRGSFFLRYWEGGAHVRLRVLPAEGAAGAVGDRIARAADAYFAAHPSTAAMSAEQYAVMAADLARHEGMADFARVMHPTDSVVFIPYRPEHDRYGYGVSLAAVERHFATSSRIALDLLAAGPTADQRSTVAFSFTVLAWLCIDVPSGARTAPPPTPEPAGGPAVVAAVSVSELAERFARQRETLLGIARRLLAVAGEEPPTAPVTTLEWLRSVRAVRDVVAAEIAAGRFVAPDGVRRVVDLCAHLFCNRLGVSVVEERYLRGLAGLTLAGLAEDGR
jgi:thiopeptide-type bacteriocin biosynthesis protein